MTVPLVLLLSAVGNAQTVTIAQISGVVSDESGGALPGVEVRGTDGGDRREQFVIAPTKRGQ